MANRFVNGKAIDANVYYDPRFVQQAIKVLPGEYCVTDKDTMLVSVIGTCVSACLIDVKNKIAGINNFLLPSHVHYDDPFGEAARFGMNTVEQLIDEMMKQGADKRHLQAKIFGGGNVVSGLSAINEGRLNADFLARYLRQESIPVIASDVLGDEARKIYFFPETGQVLVKRIKQYNNSTIMDRESAFRMRLRQSREEENIEFF
ncbi:chemoreceptor glutamine deamidase CheD [Alteromonas sp. C1M14]|uniref:chemoreceptor glutamine deamidase CheD n=1 Tax=Alteromonas sp. C1M14 TaxID=2841567 RepID=UPI001C09E8D5|nr:chemoreceptor glutamine deamidase CheD [Alteromonas sp. C1M14]MBU2979683.1 chemoreceptor glutamine deamidase CheD [Alteromonas sp. C1M14]